MAQITINIPNAQVERVRAAFEYHYGKHDPNSLPDDPQPIGAAFMKTWLAEQIKSFVLRAEREKASRENASAPPDVT